MNCYWRPSNWNAGLRNQKALAAAILSPPQPGL